MLNISRPRTAKVKAQVEYIVADKDIKISVKEDKIDYIDNLAKQAETAAWSGKPEGLVLSNKEIGQGVSIDKHTNGGQGRDTLITTEKQLKRQADHFRKLLSRHVPHAHQIFYPQRQSFQ